MPTCLCRQKEEYLSLTRSFPDDNYNASCTFDTETLGGRLSVCTGFGYAIFEISYCPICGQKLEGEK